MCSLAAFYKKNSVMPPQSVRNKIRQLKSQIYVLGTSRY